MAQPPEDGPDSAPGGAPDAGGPAARPSWGDRRPGPAFRGAVALSRRVPQLAVVKQLAFLLRRIARAVADDPVDVRHWGLRLRLRSSGNISESTFLFMPRRWDRRERAFLAAHLSPGAVFVDIGANAGGYLWWVQRVLGHRWTGVAVEPDPGLRERLRFNLATNGMTHVRVVGVAVGPAGGSARLRIDSRNLGQNVLVGDTAPPPEGPGHSVAVRVVPLPELLRDADVHRLDALKIDVEGLEAAVLEDFLDRAPGALLPRLILTELRETAEHERLLGRLEEAGYRVAIRTRLNVGLLRDQWSVSRAR